MSKLFLFFILLPTLAFAFEAPVCFQGKIQTDFVDKVCFDKEQVERLTVLETTDNISTIEVKFLNVPTPVVIISTLEAVRKKLQ